MVDLKILLTRANGTPAVLLQENRGYVVGSECPAISGHSGAPAINRRPTAGANVFNVVRFPPPHSIVDLVSIVLGPLETCRAVSRRILGATLPSHASVVVVRVLRVPARHPLDPASAAVSAGYEPLIRMPVLTRAVTNVVPFASGTSGNAGRVLRALGRALQTVFASAFCAPRSNDRPFRDVPPIAWLSREVEGFARNKSSGAFWRWLGHTFTVTQPV